MIITFWGQAILLTHHYGTRTISQRECLIGSRYESYVTSPPFKSDSQPQ